jgi:hypothetical protein
VTTSTAHITEALAATLINRAADYLEATRPIDNKTTRARLDGAGDAAHALGYGMTPNHITMIALDWVRANPRPARGGAFPNALKAWSAVGSAAVGRALYRVGYDAG